MAANHVLRFSCALILISLHACARSPEPQDPMRIPEHEFRKSVRALCLWRPSIEVPTVEAEARLQEITEILLEELVRMQYEVVPPERVSDLWMEIREREGGTFDPDTGQRIEDRHRAIPEVAYAGFRSELGCDAIVRARVGTVEVDWDDGAASWDGVTRSVEGVPDSYRGTVEAISLFVTLFDMDGREIYFRSGGIQVLSKVGFGPSGKRQLESIDAERVLEDPSEIREGVRVAVEPLHRSPWRRGSSARKSEPMDRPLWRWITGAGK